MRGFAIANRPSGPTEQDDALRSYHIAWRRIEMARPMRLYNHAVAPNPRRVRIFAAEKGIELALEDVDILAGQSRTPEFSG